eukprot:scaffold1164_cov65-Phaeocystis_antarctica.AAC.1
MFTPVISRCFCDRDLSALISDVYYNITRAHDYTFRDERNNRCNMQGGTFASPRARARPAEYGLA